MSLKINTIARSIKSAKPTARIPFSILGGSFFFVIISIKVRSNVPPSSAGMGKRFIIPKFIPINATR